MKEYVKRESSTRRELLRAAREQFAVNGFAGARLTDIAAAAGMTTGAYYRHFATKDDIVDVLFEEFADELSAALADVGDLEDFCRTWLRVHEAHCGTIRAAEDVTPQDGTYWAHRRRLRKLWASSALLHLQLARDATHRRALALVLVDTLDYYFLTRTRGWAAGTADAAAANLAQLFTEGLYGDDTRRRAGQGPPGGPREAAPEPAREGTADASITPLICWEVAAGRTEPTSRRGRSQRDAVLRSGRRVFMAAGYENATIPQVAADAGVSPGTVYRYFEDKRDLFMCLLSGAERSLFEKSMWPLGPDGRLQVRQAMRTYLATREQQRAVYRVWRELLDTDEELEKLWIASRQNFQAALARVVRKSQNDGLIAAKFNAPIVSELLVALCDGPAHAWYDLGWRENDSLSRDDLADIMAARTGDE